MADWLNELGHRVFFQDWSIEPGQDFLAKIHGALSEGAHVVALLTDDYLTSPWCQMEWNAAYKAQTDSGEQRLSPIRIKDCQPGGIMTAVAYLDLVGLGEDPARQAVLKLAHSIGKLERDPGKWSIPAPPDRPRLDNLEPFDRSIFKGRQSELDRLHQQLNDFSQIAITALAGLGGVGKSALARAFCDRYGRDYEVIWWVRSEKEGDEPTSPNSPIGPPPGGPNGLQEQQWVSEIRRRAQLMRRARAGSDRADNGVGHCGRTRGRNHPPAPTWDSGAENLN